MKRFKNNKKSLIILVLAFILISAGATFAAYSYYNNNVGTVTAITGDLNLTMNESSHSANLAGANPIGYQQALKELDSYNSGTSQNDILVYNFNVTGKNGSSKDIYYGVYVDRGADVSSKVRIEDKDLAMILYEYDGSNYQTATPSIVFSGNANDFNNRLIFSDIVGADNVDGNIARYYQLVVWIDENKVIFTDVDGNFGDKTAYTLDEATKLYANLTVSVSGDFTERNRVSTDHVLRGFYGVTTNSYPLTLPYDKVPAKYPGEFIYAEFYLLEEAKAIYVTFPNGTVKTLTESDRLVENDEIEYYRTSFNDSSFPSNMSGPYYHYILTADSSGTYEYYIEFENGIKSKVQTFNIRYENEISFTINTTSYALYNNQTGTGNIYLYAHTGDRITLTGTGIRPSSGYNNLFFGWSSDYGTFDRFHVDDTGLIDLNRELYDDTYPYHAFKAKYDAEDIEKKFTLYDSDDDEEISIIDIDEKTGKKVYIAGDGGTQGYRLGNLAEDLISQYPQARYCNSYEIVKVRARNTATNSFDVLLDAHHENNNALLKYPLTANLGISNPYSVDLNRTPIVVGEYHDYIFAVRNSPVSDLVFGLVSQTEYAPVYIESIEIMFWDLDKVDFPSFDFIVDERIDIATAEMRNGINRITYYTNIPEDDPAYYDYDLIAGVDYGYYNYSYDINASDIGANDLPNRSSYKFAGYNTSPKGDGITVLDENLDLVGDIKLKDDYAIQSGSFKQGGLNLRLYAIWKPVDAEAHLLHNYLTLPDTQTVSGLTVTYDKVQNAITINGTSNSYGEIVLATNYISCTGSNYIPQFQITPLGGSVSGSISQFLGINVYGSSSASTPDRTYRLVGINSNSSFNTTSVFSYSGSTGNFDHFDLYTVPYNVTFNNFSFRLLIDFTKYNTANKVDGIQNIKYSFKPNFVPAGLTERNIKSGIMTNKGLAGTSEDDYKSYGGYAISVRKITLGNNSVDAIPYLIGYTTGTYESYSNLHTKFSFDTSNGFYGDSRDSDRKFIGKIIFDYSGGSKDELKRYLASLDGTIKLNSSSLYKDMDGLTYTVTGNHVTLNFKMHYFSHSSSYTLDMPGPIIGSIKLGECYFMLDGELIYNHRGEVINDISSVLHDSGLDEYYVDLYALGAKEKAVTRSLMIYNREIAAGASAVLGDIDESKIVRKGYRLLGFSSMANRAIEYKKVDRTSSIVSGTLGDYLSSEAKDYGISYAYTELTKQSTPSSTINNYYSKYHGTITNSLIDETKYMRTPKGTYFDMYENRKVLQYETTTVERGILKLSSSQNQLNLVSNNNNGNSFEAEFIYVDVYDIDTFAKHISDYDFHNGPAYAIWVPETISMPDRGNLMTGLNLETDFSIIQPTGGTGNYTYSIFSESGTSNFSIVGNKVRYTSGGTTGVEVGILVARDSSSRVMTTARYVVNVQDIDTGIAMMPSFDYTDETLGDIDENEIITVDDEIKPKVDGDDLTFDWYSTDTKPQMGTTDGNFVGSGKTYTVQATDINKYLYCVIKQGDNVLAYNSNMTRISGETKYTINHYLMNNDGVNYSLTASYTYDGQIGSVISPQTLSFTNYKTPEVIEYRLNKKDNIINYFYEKECFGSTCDYCEYGDSFGKCLYAKSNKFNLFNSELKNDEYNLRYTGTKDNEPNNYIMIGDKLNRIIGVFNSEHNLKVISVDSIGFINYENFENISLETLEAGYNKTINPELELTYGDVVIDDAGAVNVNLNTKSLTASDALNNENTSRKNSKLNLTYISDILLSNGNNRRASVEKSWLYLGTNELTSHENYLIGGPGDNSGKVFKDNKFANYRINTMLDSKILYCGGSGTESDPYRIGYETCKDNGKKSKIQSGEIKYSEELAGSAVIRTGTKDDTTLIKIKGQEIKVD